MSKKSVRHAAATFLSSPQIPGVGTVFTSPPKISRSSDAYENLPPGTVSGSVIYIEILESHETRIALGGPQQGSKWVVHNMRFHLLFRSREGHSQDAADAHDDQVEDILQRCRLDRTLGSNGLIMDYGQDAEGITISSGMPKMSGTGSTIQWTIIDAHVREFLTA